MTHFSLVAAALPENEELSADGLAALADLACACGDRKLAEDLIDRLYAFYDRRLMLITTVAEPTNLLERLKG